MMKLTEGQAIDAVLIIESLIRAADKDGPGAVELRLHPRVVEEMRRLMKQIQAN